MAMLSGCGFQPADIAHDARLADSMPDTPPGVVFASCKAIHDAMPASPSGSYTLDPDGSEGDPPFTASCDMETDSGGWTVVFVADINVLTVPIEYQSSTPRLLEDAKDVLLAYRDASHARNGGFARFPLPATWRIDTPFNYSNDDIDAMVVIDGAAPIATKVRHGYQSFGNVCTDPWLGSASPYGRLCIENTHAPFYVGFATPVADNCNTSDVSWNTTPCDADLRFSIAVR